MSNSGNNVNRAAVIMILYAVVVLALSLLAYLSAPPGANATTALIMGGGSALVMIVMAVMSLMIERNRKLGMIGIHVGLILPLVLSAAFFMRIEVAHRSSGVYRYFDSAFSEKVDDGAREETEAAWTAFTVDAKDDLSGAAIPDSDKAYLGRTLTLLFGASTAAFVLLLLSRPSIPKEKESFETVTPSAPTAKPETDGGFA